MNDVPWVNYVLLGVAIVYAIAWAYDRFLSRKVARLTAQRDALASQQPPRPTGILLTPPPAPIDRGEFLQARIAYLAHMRDEEIEAEEKDAEGNVTRRIRKMTKKEMIEAINLVDEEHVNALFDTWDQVQRKQREKSL